MTVGSVLKARRAHDWNFFVIFGTTWDWNGPSPAIPTTRKSWKSPWTKGSCTSKAFSKYNSIGWEAILSHIWQIQSNQYGKRNKRIHLLESVQKVLYPLHIPGARIINQLLENSSIQCKAEVAVSIKDRRSRWTTYKNLTTWFNNWKYTLTQLGFGKQVDGKFIISN